MDRYSFKEIQQRINRYTNYSKFELIELLFDAEEQIRNLHESFSWIANRKDFKRELNNLKEAIE